MKILIINDRLDMAGGAERYTVDVACGLENLGHEMKIVYGGESKISAKGGSASGGENLKSIIGRGRLEAIFVRGLAIPEVVGEATSLDPDVIYVQNVSEPRLLEELAKIKPTVKFVHDHRVYCPGNSKMWFVSNKICPVAASWRCGWYAYLERCMTRHPKRLVENIVQRQRMLNALKKLPKVLCNSNYVRERLLQNGVLAEKVEVNPLFPGGEATGLAAAPLLSPTRRVEELNPTGFLQRGRPEILFVGRVFVEKGVEYLLRAAALLKDLPFKVVVVGEGWDLERAKKLSSHLAIREKVEFTGFLPRAEIDKYYDRCRMLVLPSVWPEPFGMVGLEALSFGKPVVAFNVGGMADWLKDGEVGYLVERGNVEELAQRVRQLLTDESLAMKLGEAGRQMVAEKFTLGRHLTQLTNVFDQAVEVR